MQIKPHFEPYVRSLMNEIDVIASAAQDAEDDVVRNLRYWKASDTLDRLLIVLRRSLRRVEDKYNEGMRAEEKLKQTQAQEAEHVSKPEPKLAKQLDPLYVPKESNEKVAEQLDRFDRREEVLNPDPFDKGNWNKF